MFGLVEYDKAHNWLYQAQKTRKLQWFQGDTPCVSKGFEIQDYSKW